MSLCSKKSWTWSCHLAAIAATGDKGSISAAAVALHSAQPVLSRTFRLFSPLSPPLSLLLAGKPSVSTFGGPNHTQTPTHHRRACAVGSPRTASYAVRTSNRRDDQRLLATTGGILVVGTRTRTVLMRTWGGRANPTTTAPGDPTRRGTTNSPGGHQNRRRAPRLAHPQQPPHDQNLSTHDSQLLHSAATAG